MSLRKIFPTLIYEAKLQTSRPAEQKLKKQILREAADLREQDQAGLAWSEDFYANGYTSYASVNELHLRSATFAELEKKIDRHVARYARSLGLKLGGHSLKMSTCWVNIMPANTHHGLHLHPLSVISGTYYVEIPPQASGIRFEDPRLDRMMNSPPRQPFVYSVEPKPGALVLFESWLRHEVPLNRSKKPRVSVSFNYEWA